MNDRTQQTVAVMLLRLRGLQPDARRDALAMLLRHFPDEFGELLGIVLQPIPGGITVATSFPQ